MYNLMPVLDHVPIAWLFVPAWNSHRSKIVTTISPHAAAQVEEEPGYAGIYPIYSLVEDTECEV